MTHTWTFLRAGGVDQVIFRSGEDIVHLAELDQKLWAALACPTRGLEFDHRTLDLIDTNHDGRIRAPELVAAAQWACARLQDPQTLMQGGDTLPLAAFSAHTEEGRALAAEAQDVLGLLGQPDATQIALADVADRSKLLAAMRFDGDGVLTPASSDGPALAEVLGDIVQTQGSVADMNGAAGFDRARAEAFFEQAAQLDAWAAKARADTTLAPLGAQTADALALVDRLRAKIDDFFARCRLAAFDPRATDALNAGEETFKSLAAQSLSLNAVPLAELPLATIAPGRALPLRQGANPFWAEPLRALQATVLQPLLGVTDALTEAQWHAVQQRLAPAQAWLAERPATALAGLDLTRVQALAAPAQRAAVMELLAQEEAAAQQHGRIGELEKLLHLQRDLLTLLNNFVSFAAFYRREGAIFQAGTLYLDARSCDLSVRVDDPAKHAVLAGMSKAYLAYCECRRDGQKMHIVSAFTAGDVDFLFVGRNGVFYDREGQDWDATITKVIENPTSIGQAFFSPYKKFLRTLEEQVAKRAAASEANAQSNLGGLAGRLAVADKPPAPGAPGAPAATPPAPARPGSRFDVGTVAALGVALGSLSAVAVGVFGKFVDLGWWIPAGLIGIVLAISGPSMLIAWLKLRQRSLGPLLDASGWAVNGRLRINVRLGASLSQIAKVPAHAHRQLHDPYAESRGPAYIAGLVALALALAVALVGWRFGLFNRLLPGGLRVPPVVEAPADAASAAPAASAASAALMPR